MGYLGVMGIVANAGRSWEEASNEARAAEASNNRLRRVRADSKLGKAADAFIAAVGDQPADNDDADDARYRQIFRDAEAGNPIVQTVAEGAGSAKIDPSSGSGKGSI